MEFLVRADSLLILCCNRLAGNEQIRRRSQPKSVGAQKIHLLSPVRVIYFLSLYISKIRRVWLTWLLITALDD